MITSQNYATKEIFENTKVVIKGRKWIGWLVYCA